MAIEVATGSLAAAEDTIASIDGEITALGVQYEAAAREYHAAKYDAALLEAAIHDRADEPRRVELQVRSLRANRSPPGEKELDKEKVKDRMLETAGELPTLPRALFRPIVDETATPSLPDDVAEQVAA